MSNYNPDPLLLHLYRCCFRENVCDSEYKFSYLVQVLLKFNLINLDIYTLQKICHKYKQLHISMPRYSNDYKEIKKLGTGGFGTVYLSQYYLDNQEYAIKKIILHHKSLHELQKIVSEIEIISKLNHPNIIRYFYSWIEPMVDRRTPNLKLLTNEGCSLTRSGSDSLIYSSNNKAASSNQQLVFFKKEMINDIKYQTKYVFYIKMELCQKGTLEDYLEIRTSINYQEVFIIINQLINGIKYLHQQAITHRDLKPSNIFVTQNNILKIGDFGLSIVDTDTRPITEYEGSELYLDKYHNESHKFSDIYSLGVIIIELLYIFKTSMERVLILSNLSRKNLNKIIKNELLIETIFNCIRDDYQNRYDIHQLYKEIQRVNSSKIFSNGLDI